MRHTILWDGECGFCRRTVEWLLRRDRQHLFEAVPYQTAQDPRLTPELRRACAQAVHVITADGKVLRGARAVLFLLESIGGGKLARWASYPPLVWLLEAAYRFVANHRDIFDRLLFPRQSRTGGCHVHRHN
ncbi:hypothetical protein CWRG_01132 [Chthonomonas calidirosea]|uniref:thiol-disulfide oxidoreductase DCC family protein n=1 Tax=Chthonomonas calidirosea TaxID=454171 RepID=UPI0006DD3F51|nr:DUF393 domain-containing protein [Chthonomonas calidirosea]CEK15360.1 hypothetical protein CWRG_01132 [Chthonomonas calidirosea]